MSRSIKKNLSLQTLYQILNTALPLITSPYLARVLGATPLGIFSYTSSIVSYFTLLAMAGTVSCGTKNISEVGNNKEERSKIFWSIYAFQFIISLFSILLYIFYLSYFCKNNLMIAEIQLFSLIGCILDISWLFFGVEDFKIVVTRSMVIKILTVISILIFVKKPEDLWIYTTIMVSGTVLNQFILWFYAPRFIKLKKVTLKEIFVHVRPNLMLFIPLLAMSVYRTMDKTMLGLLSTYKQAGFYYNTDKVINIPLCVINGVGTVMLPRMSRLLKSGKIDDANKIFRISLEGVVMVSCAMSFGIAAISREFVPVFFGDGFNDCIILIIALAPVLIIKGLSNTVRMQYLVPMEMEKLYTQSVVLGAIINLILNIVLIPKLGALGAVLGTLMAELVSCVLQLYGIRKKISLKKCYVNSIVYLVIGVIMFYGVRLLAMLNTPIFIKIILEITIGTILYLGLTIIFWKISHDEMSRSIFGNIINKK
ncbi:flippase [Clostridium perfringens]